MNRVSKMFLGLGLGAVLSVGTLPSANAADIPFDPDGPGPLQFLGLNGNTPLGMLAGLDWGVGNAVAVGAVPLVVGAEFTVHYQAKLATFDLAGGNGTSETNFNADGNIGTAQTISGVNPSFEWTANARFTERVVSIVGNTAVFEVVDDPNNYLKIFYDDTPIANTALGTGYIDGQEILSASIVIGSSSSITIQGTGTIDGTPGGDLSVLIGNGGFNIQAIIDSWDDDFLGFSSVALAPGEVMTTVITSTLELPFGPGGVAVQMEQVGGVPVVVDYGAFNGATGPDFQFEADSNETFAIANLAVPEPATAALGLMALAGLALRGRRSRNA